MFETIAALRRGTKAGPLVAALVVALVPALATLPAAAQALLGGIQKGTPAENFNDEDMRLYVEASQKALNDMADGQAVRWENPATGSRGEVTPLKTFTWDGHRCRELRTHNESRGRSHTSVGNLCRVDDKWRAVAASQLKK